MRRPPARARVGDMESLDPVDALRRLGTVADGATLRVQCGGWPLRKAVQEGRVLHVGRNRYALPGAPEALLAAGKLHGAASHLSAAMAWGWKIKHPPPRPVVTVPRGRAVREARRAGLDVRWQALPAGDVHGGSVTTRTRTVIDCARTLPFDEALCVADSALREGVVTRDQLLAAAVASPRSGRSRATRVVAAADGASANPFESCLRAIAHDVPGLSVRAQFAVAGVGHADLGDGTLRLLIEADSYRYHSDEAAFRYDIRRYTDMVRRGWTVVRFCWDDVMHRPNEVRAVLIDLVAQLSPEERPVRVCDRCGAA